MVATNNIITTTIRVFFIFPSLSFVGLHQIPTYVILKNTHPFALAYRCSS